jgi:hypothetical protein
MVCVGQMIISSFVVDVTGPSVGAGCASVVAVSVGVGVAGSVV